MKNLADWPFVEAANYTNTNGRRIRLIVIHTMETDEGLDTAEAVARYFASGSVQASAHLNIDANSIVRGVRFNDVAWAAPGANHDGIQIELAGRAGQSKDSWNDDYSRRELRLAADAVAQLCLRYKIPARHLSNSELGAGLKGIIGHVQASEVYKQSSHWDPGPNFPWGRFIRKVKYRMYVRRLTSPPTLKVGDEGWFVTVAQRRLNQWEEKFPKQLTKVRVDGTFNKEMRPKVVAFQQFRRIEADGVIGPQTWRNLLSRPR